MEKELVKLNIANKKNAHMREEIENLRRERVIFDGIYAKLENEYGDRIRLSRSTCKTRVISILDA
jgi:hypothetical protein